MENKSENSQLQGPPPYIVKVAVISALVAYVCYSSDSMQFFAYKQIEKWTNSPEAQYRIGTRHLYGLGVYADPEIAMQWFRKAADQGHPRASFDLAIAHLKGFRKDLLEEGEAKKMIKYAADQGVHEARQALIDACSKGLCDD